MPAGITLKGVVGRFYARLEAVSAASWQDGVSMFFPSTASQEEYKWLGQSPKVREWIGGREAKGLREGGVIVKNKRFEATLPIDVDELRQDQTSQLTVRVDDLAGRVQEHWHRLLSTLIETPGNSYDGVAYFGATHVEGESGTQRNIFTASEITQLDVTTANNPTVAELEAALPKVVEKFFGLKDDQGEPMNDSARSFLVMVPTNMWAAAAGALNLPLINDGAGATRNNLLVSLGGYDFQLAVNPRLTADTVFYTFRTDAATKAFIRQEEFFETAEADETFQNNRRLFGVKTLRNVGTGFWQYALKSTLS